jgi:hypothetical protein
LGVTLKTGEAKEKQRDAKEAAKKSDGAKTRSWAGATPLFGPSLPKVTRGVAPAPRRTNSAACFGPSPQGEKKERNWKRGRRKRVLRISEQPVILKRKIRLEQDASEHLDDYARFIGIGAEDVLNIVLKKMIVNDMEFQSWLSQQNIQQQSSQSPLGLSARVAETEAA